MKISHPGSDADAFRDNDAVRMLTVLCASNSTYRLEMVDDGW